MSLTDQPKKSFIGLSYEDLQLYIPKPDTWDQMITIACQSFSLDREQVSKMRIGYLPDIDYNSSTLWYLGQEAWWGVRDNSGIHFVDQENDEMQKEGGTKHTQTSRRWVQKHPHVFSVTLAGEKGMQIFVKDLYGKTHTFQTSKSATVLQLKEMCEFRFGLPVDRQRIIYSGRKLVDGWTLEGLNILKESTIHMVSRTVGGKPAIYLLSPRPLHDVQVFLDLSWEWKFSVLYPPTEELPWHQKATRVRWTVDVQPDGTLKDKKTGLSCSYLFWEAEAQSPDERLDEEDKSDLTTFHPSIPRRFMQHAGDYEALPFDEFLPYLDSVLADLCLTTAMRTDFIVYWLPAFQRIRDRGLQIKFTFVPQRAFMKAAGLEIRDNSRMPATETRIFMLFTGVDPLSLRRECYSFDGSKDWVRHVGLNKEVMEDTEAFRVLEWGGMEVPY
ncbi:viral Ubiquitin [Apiospora arundinis]